MNRKYINEEQLSKFKKDVDDSGVKQDVLAKLIGCTSTYFSLMVTGKKKVDVNKMVMINHVLERYIALYRDLSTNKKRVTDTCRINSEYGDLICKLKKLENYSDLTTVSFDINNDYLKDKLEKCLNFGLDENTSPSVIGSSLINVIKCYG